MVEKIETVSGQEVQAAKSGLNVELIIEGALTTEIVNGIQKRKLLMNADQAMRFSRQLNAAAMPDLA